MVPNLLACSREAAPDSTCRNCFGEARVVTVVSCTSVFEDFCRCSWIVRRLIGIWLVKRVNQRCECSSPPFLTCHACRGIWVLFHRVVNASPINHEFRCGIWAPPSVCESLFCVGIARTAFSATSAIIIVCQAFAASKKNRAYNNVLPCSMLL